MQVTRRYWAGTGLAGLLAVAGVVAAQPLLVVGAAVLGAWLVVQQALFVSTVRRIRDQLVVSQSVARDRVLANDDLHIVLEATLPTDLGNRQSQLEITAALPSAITHPDVADRRVILGEGTTDATTTVTVETPVAGHFEFEPSEVTIYGPDGLFHSTFQAPTDTTPAVTVVPRRPRNLHVGQGGDQIVSAFGNHKTGEFGLGLEPGEVREYVPGDTIRQIDWKATARSTSPHVREFEEETDRQTIITFDQRASMATGAEGETKLDYARQVALAFVDHAQSNHEPIGFYGIGDGGITTREPSDVAADTYARIQTALHDMTPTGHQTRMDHRGPALTAPHAARQTADRLETTDSSFASQLQPYFEASQTYIQRVNSDPLYKTVQSELAGGEGTVTAIVVTDDRHRAEVRETVKLARKYRGDVLVFITPTVLFEREGLTDIDVAYNRYADFEDFRRDLTRLEQVSAYEIAPGDRLEALLASQSAAHTARN